MAPNTVPVGRTLLAALAAVAPLAALVRADAAPPAAPPVMEGCEIATNVIGLTLDSSSSISTPEFEAERAAVRAVTPF